MQTTIASGMGILIDFNLEEMAISRKAVGSITEDSNYKDFAKIVSSELIDVVEYNDEIDIVIDDEGLLKSGNPVLEITTPYGKYELAGKLLFLKKQLNGDGIKLIGLDTGEAFKLLMELDGNIRPIGVTK